MLRKTIFALVAAAALGSAALAPTSASAWGRGGGFGGYHGGFHEVIAIRSPEGIYTTNVAYGGADRRDLYITESYSATILRARVDVPGRQMFSHL